MIINGDKFELEDSDDFLPGETRMRDKALARNCIMHDWYKYCYAEECRSMQNPYCEGRKEADGFGIFSWMTADVFYYLINRERTVGSLFYKLVRRLNENDGEAARKKIACGDNFTVPPNMEQLRTICEGFERYMPELYEKCRILCEISYENEKMYQNYLLWDLVNRDKGHRFVRLEKYSVEELQKKKNELAEKGMEEAVDAFFMEAFGFDNKEDLLSWINGQMRYYWD